MCNTYKKWDVEKKKQRKAYKAREKKWDAIQNEAHKAIKKECAAIKKKAHDDAKKKHAAFLKDMKQTKKRFGIAKSQWQASRLRIMRKARDS